MSLSPQTLNEITAATNALSAAGTVASQVAGPQTTGAQKLQVALGVVAAAAPQTASEVTVFANLFSVLVSAAEEFGIFTAKPAAAPVPPAANPATPAA